MELRIKRWPPGFCMRCNSATARLVREVMPNHRHEDQTSPTGAQGQLVRTSSGIGPRPARWTGEQHLVRRVDANNSGFIGASEWFGETACSATYVDNLGYTGRRNAVSDRLHPQPQHSLVQPARLVVALGYVALIVVERIRAHRSSHQTLGSSARSRRGTTRRRHRYCRRTRHSARSCSCLPRPCRRTLSW